MTDSLKGYFNLLNKWNKKINLTSIKDWDEFLSKHVIDVKELIPFIGVSDRVIDLGAGAGLPGIVLKVMRPDVDVTLLDSTRKKVSFCDEAIRRLSLTGIKAVWGRAEDCNLTKSLGKFDVVVSRATWPLDKYLEISKSYLSRDGICISFKGKGYKEELIKLPKASRSLYHLETIKKYGFETGPSRYLLVFRYH